MGQKKRERGWMREEDCKRKGKNRNRSIEKERGSVRKKVARE